MKEKIRVGILGATGIVGQQYAELLQDHPWFDLCFLAASDKSAGHRFGDLIAQKSSFAHLKHSLLEKTVHNVQDYKTALKECHVVFSALNGVETKETETLYAQEGFCVISNTSAYRKDPLVPLLIPEINAHHLDILPLQKEKKNWKGFLVVKSNCSLQSFLLPLSLIDKEYGLQQVHITTVQAVSGAGYPGVASLDILGNVVPYIEGEEEKTESEPLKVMGHLSPQGILPLSSFVISAQCLRAPVIDGHLATVSFSTKEKLQENDLIEMISTYRPSEVIASLPSSPKEHTLIYHKDRASPQPRKHASLYGGMAFHVGRIRPCPVLDYKFIGLSHNTLRGAAGGGVYNAELLVKLGYITHQ